MKIKYLKIFVTKKNLEMEGPQNVSGGLNALCR